MQKYFGFLMAVVLLAFARPSQATVTTYFVALCGAADVTGYERVLGHGRITIDSERYSIDWSFDVPGITGVKQATIRTRAGGLMVVRFRNELEGSGLRSVNLSSIVESPQDFYVSLRPQLDTRTLNVRTYRDIRGHLSDCPVVPEPKTMTLVGVALGLGAISMLRRALNPSAA